MEHPLAIYLMLVPALPLAAAIIIAALGARLLKSQSHLVLIAALAGSFVCSLLVAYEVNSGHAQIAEAGGSSFSQVYTLWTWADVAGENATGLPGDFTIDIALRADGLTSIMLCMVTFVSTLVAIFGSGYMQGDRGYWRFFAYIGLFVFSMTMLVSVSNFVLLFVFWEAVGACSYFLIGFWYEKPEAAAAGKKAFLVNRVGDFGFMLALFLIFTTYGTLNYHDADEAVSVFGDSSVAVSEGSPGFVDLTGPAPAASDADETAGVLSDTRINSEDGYQRGGIALAICLLLLVGACGKSAQFPLHVWLPDAMEGPTPVSALIHAATMVTAGVYMVARCTPLFWASPEAQLVVSVVGGFTALLAGLIALTQYDLKRVLAYSTVSQLGYMFLALGVGTMSGVTAGMFHLFTHAFFKALLFLAAGSVMHAMGNVIDMRRFGGLRNIMPITHWTFLAGCVALAGLAPFSGFWSKDAILGAVHDKAHAITAELDVRAGIEPHHAGHEGEGEHGPTGSDANIKQMGDEQLQWHGFIYGLLFNVGAFVAFLTAFYTFRAFFMTFYGEEMIPAEAHGHAHESPPSMWVPLAILAGCAVAIGGMFYWTDFFANFISFTPSLAGGEFSHTAAMSRSGFHTDVAGMSTAIVLIAIGLSAYFYLGSRAEIEVVRSGFDFGFVSQLSLIRWKMPWLQLRRPVFWMMTGGLILLFFAVLLATGNLHTTGEGGWLSHVAFFDAFPLLSQSDWATAQFPESVTHILHAMELAVRLVLFIWLTIGVLWLVVIILCYLSPISLYVTPYKLSYGKFFIDEIYNYTIVWPLKLFAAFSFWIDQYIVDALVNFVGSLPPKVGNLIRGTQLGLVQFYALAMVLGLVIILAASMLLQ